MSRAIPIGDEAELNISQAHRVAGRCYGEVSRLMKAAPSETQPFIRSWYNGRLLVTNRIEIRAFQEREKLRREQALKTMSDAVAAAREKEREAARAAARKKSADDHYSQFAKR